jgi:cyclopropane-fatty-acyl-phospholipid synthase
VVDIGSGFGGFLLHAQEHYGVRVTSVNTTGSQAEHVRRQIEGRGVGDSIQMHADFRNGDGKLAREFDKVVSIGCLEHAGRDQLAEVIRSHAKLLKKGGLGLIHFIGHVGRHDTDFFIRKYVFPGGWIPSLADVICEMEKAGLEVLDIENLRRHYAITLDHWAARFDLNWERIRALDPRRFNERFRRIWRVYLYGCAEMFRSPLSHTHLFQIVFSKGNVSRSSFPMTRDFLYEGTSSEENAARLPREKRSVGRPS